MKNSGENKIANLGYAFQTQDYYMQIKEISVEEDVKRIVDFTLDNKTKEMIKNRQKELQKLIKEKNSKFDISCFQACVNYPGLVVGMSNPVMSSLKQGSKNKEGQDSAFKTGFSFDYVTGLPYIPGSSIKGMLRASIEKYKTDVCQWLKDSIGISADDRLFKEMISEMFGGENDEVNDDKMNNNTNVLERDVFLDAIIIDGSHDKILKSDYITPHSSMFKNPIPIRILTIKPEVKLEFHFLLREKTIAKMNREQRFELYKSLILDLGIGAKTNTGYGSLKEV